MADDTPVTTGRQLTFRVGRGRFAMLLENVLGVQAPAEVEPGSGGGVMFNGHPVAALDARSLGWGGSDPPAPVAAVIIVGGGTLGEVALIVDRIEGIVEGVEMRPLPALVAPFVRGAFRGFALHADGGRLMVDSVAVAAAGKMAARDGQRGPGEA